MKNIDKINAIRLLGADMIDEANSGHPGIVMGAAPMMYTLFSKHININSEDSTWANRDRFVMSAGHGSALLYSMLHLTGHKLTIEDVKKFRKIDSLTPGHPELGHTDGVDSTSGPLGQGIATAVGMAMAEDHLNAKTKNKGYIDHYTYAICGDGDLQEGVSYESMALAGRHELSKLIILWDSNDIQLDSDVKTTTSTNQKMHIESLGWEHILVKDGENVDEIDAAIAKAKKSKKPTMIEVKTIIGFGAGKQGTSDVHGAPFGKEETQNIRNKFGVKYGAFEIPSEIKEEITSEIRNRVKPNYDSWKKLEPKFKTEYKDIYSNLDFKNRSNNKIDFSKIEISKGQATRVTSGQVLDGIQKQLPIFFGGSADLTASTKVRGIDGNYDINSKDANNIKFGVREFAMAVIVNGITMHGGLISFGSTFFTFCDYMKPALRLSAVMKIPSISVYTHDSVFVGEDGPTHEPVEQISSLRSIPNYADFRPADTNELIASWQSAMSMGSTPSAIIATRQNLPELEGSSVKEALNGGYVVYGDKDADVVMFASGSEVSLAIDSAKLLQKDGIKVKVISIVSAHLFDLKGRDYYRQLVGNPKLRVIVEAGARSGLDKYIAYEDLAITLDRFGISGDGGQVYNKLGFNKEDISKKVKANLK